MSTRRRNECAEHARRVDDQFVRFINMLINDTTFMLSEVLDGLHAINEHEQTDENTWDRVS